ncbi:CoA-transferase family III domain-containing protein [Penicillium cinerascens]|uniref:CoA-transferase family III domain-containing protein n=1 Tax=Penicillium cinerascens TaxID=70096 RepID=A0A9W9MN83_9EURO|nr:CoA-transferase family III domain-containing protein [Penicillium cinerascens]KAJ5204417.1 CoA-transferase family III domain-containing protein [Penicillium cinerascens]
MYSLPRTVGRLPSQCLLRQTLTTSIRLSLRRNHTSTAKATSAGPLAGVRILDLTRVLAGPFCTQILADYGADVIKVENPQGGDDTRLWREAGEEAIWKPDASNTSIYFNTINRNKRSIAVNLKNEKGRDIILGLARKADVIVENFIPGKLDKMGLGYDVLKSINPSIILASISGYGAEGPYAQRAGYDVIGAAEGGLLHITGEADGPPTKPGVGLMDMCTGLYLHGAIASALLARERTGHGQKIGTSLFETTVSILANVGMSWMNLGKEAHRWGTGHPTIVPYEAFKTKDSFIVVGAVNNRQFKTLCGYLGKEELCTDSRFVDNNVRVQNRNELKHILDGLFVLKSTSEWEKIFEGSGMPYGPINNLEKVFSHPQTTARNMVQTVEQSEAVSGNVKVLGMPVKFSKSKPSIREGPPSLGQHTDDVLQELGLTSEVISQLRKGGVIGNRRASEPAIVTV